MAFWIIGWIITSIMMTMIGLAELTPEEERQGKPFAAVPLIILMCLFAWPLYLMYAIFWFAKELINEKKLILEEPKKNSSTNEIESCVEKSNSAKEIVEIEKLTKNISIKTKQEQLTRATQKRYKSVKKIENLNGNHPAAKKISHGLKDLQDHPSPGCKGLVKYLEIYLNNIPKHLLITGNLSAILYDFRRWLTDSNPEKYEIYKQCFSDFNLWQTRDLIESKLYLKKPENKQTSKK